KVSRAALVTPNIDYNGRFCMSSAAAASLRAFGLDRGLPFPLEDIAQADAVLLVGGNPAETMPPFMQYLEEQRAKGGRLIVVDPVRSPTAQAATLHLQIVPGTDAALANGLLHVLVRERLFDAAFIEGRTEGFAQVRASVAGYWPDLVERITGVPEAQLVQAARMLGCARSPMVLTGRGRERLRLQAVLVAGRAGRSAGAAGRGLEPRRVRARRGADRGAAALARLPRRLRLLPLRDGSAGARRAALGAVGRGRRNDDESRGPRVAPPTRQAPSAGRADGCRSTVRHRRSPRARSPLQLRRSARGLRRAAPRQQGRACRLFRHQLREDRRAGRRLLALPRRRPSRAAA